MDAKTLYSPILKGKANDLKALGKIPRSLALHVHALVELLSPNGRESIETACVRFAHQLRKHCPLNAVSVDLHAIAPEHVTNDGSPALEALCTNLRGLGILFTPVFGFDHEPELWDRIVPIATSQGRGLTFRLKIDDLEAGEDTIYDIIERLRYAHIPTSDTKILIDLESIGNLDSVSLVRLRGLTQDFVEVATTVAKFGLISVIGSSMPKDVSDVKKEGTKAFYRHEMPLWLNVAAGVSSEGLAFGDYGIVHPNFSDKIIPKHPNAKIRYTRGLHHHIFRGYSLREGLKYQQYSELARRVLNSSVFLDRNYSFGDDYVWRCANGEERCGNLGTWVEVDMNHHLVHVAAQLPQILTRVAAGVSANELLAMDS
ncbi:beta family protein [Paralcaligenes sp. KSB-10]|uniref:beta family protein n=1 Tax=Paralcaligenes sp. KSB-10 TaxID=2901142 RepID=UPI001E2E96AD|nr:beta family protein [Paralcaligenes sp. KSB-10]UHL62962.1 beta family protein [Paralcaligenes sp. KSB-10]